MSKILGPLVLALCLALGFGRPASAQIPAGAIAFSPDATLSLDGGLLTVELTSWTCNEGATGTRASPIATPCPNQLYLVPSGTGLKPSFMIEAFSGTTEQPIEYANCASTACTGFVGGFYDLGADLTVTTSGGAKLVGASAAVGGSVTNTTGNFNADVGGSETVTGGCATELMVNLSGGDPNASCTFAATNTLYLNKDMGLLNLAGLGTQTPTFQLESITEGFTLAPEPASMACLMAGVVGLVVVRRKRRHT